MRLTVTLAKSHCLLDTAAALFPTWQAWVNALQVGSAAFVAANATEENVRCRIAEKDHTLQATGPQPYTHAGAWFTAFYLAMFCREKDRLTALFCTARIELREHQAEQPPEVGAVSGSPDVGQLMDDDVAHQIHGQLEQRPPETLPAKTALGGVQLHRWPRSRTSVAGSGTAIRAAHDWRRPTARSGPPCPPPPPPRRRVQAVRARRTGGRTRNVQVRPQVPCPKPDQTPDAGSSYAGTGRRAPLLSAIR